MADLDNKVVELIIKPEVGYPTKIKLPFSGYDIQLFCGDFINFKFLYLFLI